MPREDWQVRGDPFLRGRDDFGRSHDDGLGARRASPEPRSWVDRAGDFIAGRRAPPEVETRPPRPPRSVSDLVLRTMIVERLEAAPDLDLRHVDVAVCEGQVMLEGAVRSKADRRRVEDLADIKGVRSVQNYLRVHGPDHWTFL